MHPTIRTVVSPIPASELILRPDGSLYHLGVRREDVASKIIIVGDPERVPVVSGMFDTVEVRISSREFVIHTGVFEGKRLTVASSGIGVDNIDILINELDAAVNIDLRTRMPNAEVTQLEFIRIGTSGVLHPHIPVGSIVASSFAFGLDGVPHSYRARLTSAEEELLNALKTEFVHLGQHPGLYVAEASPYLLARIAPDAHHGITATANGFYGPQGRSLRMQSMMEPLIDAYASFRHKNLFITNFEMECSGVYALASLLGHQALTVCLILANRATKEFHSDPSKSMESLIRQVIQRF